MFHYTIIGDHIIGLASGSARAERWVRQRLRAVPRIRLQSDRSRNIEPDLDIQVQGGDDLRIERDEAYRAGVIEAASAEQFAEAIACLYGAFAVHRNWGMLVEAAVRIERGQAHLILESSGQYALLRVGQGAVHAYGWPLDAPLQEGAPVDNWPLVAIRKTEGASIIRHPSQACDALLARAVLDRAQQEISLAKLCRRAADSIPYYEGGD